MEAVEPPGKGQPRTQILSDMTFVFGGHQFSVTVRTISLTKGHDHCAAVSTK